MSVSLEFSLKQLSCNIFLHHSTPIKVFLNLEELENRFVSSMEKLPDFLYYVLEKGQKTMAWDDGSFFVTKNFNC